MDNRPQDCIQHFTLDVIRKGANAGVFVVDQLVNTGFLLRFLTLLNAKCVSSFAGLVIFSL